jgi:hypothetical protein
MHDTPEIIEMAGVRRTGKVQGLALLMWTAAGGRQNDLDINPAQDQCGALLTKPEESSWSPRGAFFFLVA